MNINPSIKSGDLGRIGGNHEGGDNGNTLLSQLGQKVSDALDKNRGASVAQNSVDNQLVKDYISSISSQPLAGMNHSFLV